MSVPSHERIVQSVTDPFWPVYDQRCGNTSFVYIVFILPEGCTAQIGPLDPVTFKRIRIGTVHLLAFSTADVLCTGPIVAEEKDQGIV